MADTVPPSPGRCSRRSSSQSSTSERRKRSRPPTLKPGSFPASAQSTIVPGAKPSTSATWLAVSNGSAITPSAPTNRRNDTRRRNSEWPSSSSHRRPRKSWSESEAVRSVRTGSRYCGAPSGRNGGERARSASRNSRSRALARPWRTERAGFRSRSRADPSYDFSVYRQPEGNLGNPAILDFLQPPRSPHNPESRL